MKKTGIVLLVMALLVTLGSPLQLSAQAKGKKIPAIKKGELEYWVNHISSDTMRGRKNGSPEMKITAQWIAGKFKEAGLKPFPSNDGYMQHYYIKRSKDSIAENNVIGYIEGSDPKLKNEYIVISAHFDHIGVGRPVQGDSIYNGANDNASGTCAVIGVAKTLKMMKAKPARSIVFVTFSGEEMGIRGSRYFTGHAPLPIASVYLNINFEMLGHCTVLGEKRYMITGPKMDNLAEMLHDYNRDKDWKLIDSVKDLAALFYQSDNIAFANYQRKDNISYGVPAHTFVTWNGENHLHKPNDEAKYFNFDNYRDFIQYMSGLAIYIAENKTPIDWTTPKFQRIKN
jgi:hypothetical protein